MEKPEGEPATTAKPEDTQQKPESKPSEQKVTKSEQKQAEKAADQVPEVKPDPVPEVKPDQAPKPPAPPKPPQPDENGVVNGNDGRVDHIDLEDGYHSTDTGATCSCVKSESFCNNSNAGVTPGNIHSELRHAADAERQAV